MWDTGVLGGAAVLMEAEDWEGEGEQAELLLAVLSRKDPCTGQRFTERKHTPRPFLFLSEGLPGSGVLEFIGSDERAFQG